MTARKLCIILATGLGGLLLALIASTYAITGLLKTKSAQLASNNAQVEQLTNQQAGIAKSKRDIASYSQLEAVTKKIVPQDKDQAEAVRQITNIAGASNVTLTNIAFPSSTLGNTAGGVKTATPAAAAPSAVATTRPNLSQLTPVANIPGVYNLQITLGNNANNPVTFTQLNNFLRGLENNRRTAAVSTVNILPQADNPNQIVFTLVINIYIKPS